MLICTFCGHSSVPEEIRPLLAAEIERHIVELGVTEFWVGNYGGFDRMAKAEVRKAKERHPEVKLYLLVPYMPAEDRRISTEGVDQVLFPAELETVPKRLSIPRLNRHMVQRADYLIAYVSHVSGGAYKTLGVSEAAGKVRESWNCQFGEKQLRLITKSRTKTKLVLFCHQNATLLPLKRNIASFILIA